MGTVFFVCLFLILLPDRHYYIKETFVIRAIEQTGTIGVYYLKLRCFLGNIDQTVQKIVRFAYSRKASVELIERGIESLKECRPEVLYGDFMACDRFDIMNEVGKIDLPTLILCGN